jgi:tripartite-type tricarboxylate transporter receptor subunit TctC
MATRREVTRLLLGVPLAAAAPRPRRAAAQEDAGFPTRPVRIVVGFTAGGGNDILARLIGQKLSELLGQTVVIENKPGAGAIIATEHVAKSAPDGHTLLVGASGAMSINPAVHARLTYATLRDFIPISMIAAFPLVLVVKATSPIRSVSDLIAYAKANPDKANYASSSTAFRMVTELFKLRTGAPMEHVAYRGSGDSILAVMSGVVLLTIADTPPLMGQIRAGELRPLAVTSTRRAEDLPDVPTMIESGIDMDVRLWSGLFAPAATPPAVVRRLEDAMTRIVALPDIRDRLRQLGVDPVGNRSEQFAALIAADIDRWTTVARAANIKIED